jgi:ribosomal-protein-alanine N-acetyltransferase
MGSDAAPETLETDRLSLRPQRSEDAPVFRQLWEERDERVPAHRRIDADGHPTIEDIAAHIDSRPGLLTVVLRKTGDVIGYCGVVFDGSGDPDEPELAFELLRAVHNRGYATEAGRAVLAWAQDAGHRRVWATVWDWNVPSRRALEKLGFTETGTVTKESPHGKTLLTVREF